MGSFNMMISLHGIHDGKKLMMQNTLYSLPIKWNYSLEYCKIENLECPNFGILSNKWKLYRSEWYTQNDIHHIFIMVYWESNF